MKKKTILYVGGFELPDKNAAAQRVLAVAKIFKDLGFNVVFLGIDKSLDSNYSIEDTKSNYFGFDSWAMNYPKNKREWLKYISTSREVEYLVHNYYKNDLYAIICYNHPFLSQYKIRNICIENNSFYIPDATEWYSSKGKGVVYSLIKWLDTSLRMRYIHKKSDGIIATSKYLSDYYNKNKCNVLDLPSMFDSSDLSEVKVLDIKKNKDTIYLMYAGSAYDENNPENAKKNIKDRLDKIIILMYEMYKIRKNFIFNIFGLEKNNYLLAFPEHFNMLNDMKKHIYFHGKIPHKKVIGYIKYSDFTIFLRDIDRVTLSGFPTKFSESLICDTPVLTNRISNIERYLIDDKNGFYLDYENFDLQKEQMLKILSLNPEYIDGMNLYCKNNKNLDYKKFIELTNKFLDSLNDI